MNNRIRERLDRIEAQRRHEQEMRDQRNREINALEEARNNATTLVQSYITTRDQIQEDLGSEQYAYANNKKYTGRAYSCGFGADLCGTDLDRCRHDRERR